MPKYQRDAMTCVSAADRFSRYLLGVTVARFRDMLELTASQSTGASLTVL